MAGYESWIDRQIREAQERGEFDNLRGAGQPIPGLGGREDENWWVKGLLERENLRPPLPGSLLLRKETVEIADTVADCVTEDQVREIVRDLNTRILNARRRGIDGPNIVIPNVDVDRVVGEWRERRRAS
ncbi:MAG TPA: DUF1992 domain-containing protein [Microlunatus sp.]|jgi:hypothetical protein|nr:DUF1992 domain-containing protein [Microlunatus sp.]